ncbi:hypothetical protein [Eisenibacter elegans]|uniref:hypothetical protein n=1 Tax=Eisenibacter elegans TaxID=997 RepID=UPI0003FB850B|nr:hypothetical protein [Eisenibacter elegans]
MNVLKENNWISVSYDASNKHLRATWKPESADMPEDDFRAINSFYVTCFQHHTITSFLIDSREFNFPISPEAQTWVGEEIIPAVINLGLSRLAFMMSKEFIAQLSIEQTMEEGGNVPFQIKYFSDLDEAQAWCFAAK